MDDKDLNIDSFTQQLSQGEGFDARSNTIIKVIGVGGGGNNAVNHMYLQTLKTCRLSCAIPTVRLSATHRCPKSSR